MWIANSEKYQEQKQVFNFKESCEDCRHFCLKREMCAMLYPTKPHRKKTFESAKIDERIYFCKMFEAK